MRILAAVAEYGSLTAAADKLHLTQSALSHAIKKLEQHAGVALWQKEGRQLVFTQAGEHLRQESKRLLPQLERLDAALTQYALGEQGSLRIGMECHPCYRWLLRVVEPFLIQWPGVDVDVRQQFQFGGMAALFNRDIDLLVTPDPLQRKGIVFEPVFVYEQVLVVADSHRLAGRSWISAEELGEEVLLTYPVEPERLDIFKDFLIPANCSPARHKVIEATEIMLQMVATERGVASLPRWLVEEHQESLALSCVRLGKKGVRKQIHLGRREDERSARFITAFIELALSSGN